MGDWADDEDRWRTENDPMYPGYIEMQNDREKKMASKIAAKSSRDSKNYWKNRYAEQRAMEKETRWKFCPWCGSMLAVYPEGLICGESDFPD